MKVGIKFGPSEDVGRLQESGAKYPDIWYIPEPQIDKMIENYFELKKLLEN